MSRSNYDKPFYVDVGTSIVAIRCASNHDVLVRYDHARFPQSIKLTEDVCDRMNKEVEIGKPLRNCDVGTAEEQAKRFHSFCESNKQCGDVYSCERCKLNSIEDCELAWSQMPYEEGVAE